MAATSKKAKRNGNGASKKGATSARRPAKKEFLGYDISEKARLKVVGENPRRKGSGPWKQYEEMRGGRTVAAYLKAGGRRMWIPGAVRRKFIKITR